MMRERWRAKERCTPDAGGKIGRVELDYFSHHSLRIEDLFRQPRSQCGKIQHDCDVEFECFTKSLKSNYARLSSLEGTNLNSEGDSCIFSVCQGKQMDVLYFLTFFEFMLFI